MDSVDKFDLFLATFFVVNILALLARKPLTSILLKLFELNRRFNPPERIEHLLKQRGYSAERIERYANARNPDAEQIERFLNTIGLINATGCLAVYAVRQMT